MREILVKNKAIFVFIAKCLSLAVIYQVLFLKFLEPILHLDSLIINNLIVLSNGILQFIGYNTFIRPGMIGIEGTPGLIVSPVCDALDLMALYSIFLISFPGKISAKAWFIPLGILIIHAMNVVRIALLAIIEKHAPEKLEFNHSYTFTLFVYLIIFLMWMWWVKKQKLEAGS